MAKPKNPLLSLGASGTIADTLTYQKRGQDTITRKKPIPTYRYTLPQAYQRWLYQDYAYLWTQQTPATKQEYATAGSRFHLTGFQYWMKYNLANLPDIVGRWHLDERSGAIAYDSSNNHNNGTIIGASPTTGLIAGAYYFDDINDTINCGTDPSLDLGVDSFDIECFIKTTDTDQYSYIVSKRSEPRAWVLRLSHGKPTLYLKSSAPWQTIQSPTSIADGLWHYLIGRINRDTNQGEVWVDNIKKANADISAHDSWDNPNDLHISSFWMGVYFLGATLDQITLYSRNLDSVETLRHSERRYPP